MHHTDIDNDAEVANELYEEIRQISRQYCEEVPSKRRTWPESIKSRVYQLWIQVWNWQNHHHVNRFSRGNALTLSKNSSYESTMTSFKKVCLTFASTLSLTAPLAMAEVVFNGLTTGNIPGFGQVDLEFPGHGEIVVKVYESSQCTWNCLSATPHVTRVHPTVVPGNSESNVAQLVLGLFLENGMPTPDGISAVSLLKVTQHNGTEERQRFPLRPNISLRQDRR